MSRLRERKIYWIAGAGVSLSGVAAVRLLAPQLNGEIGKALLIFGYLLSLAGIIIVAYGAAKH